MFLLWLIIFIIFLIIARWLFGIGKRRDMIWIVFEETENVDGTVEQTFYIIDNRR